MRFFWLVALASSLLSSCGYRFNDEDPTYQSKTISIPFVKGDTTDGQLTAALVREISTSGRFQYVGHDAHLTLQVVIVQDDKEKIGYRYDRHPISGKLRHNLVPTEGRRVLKTEVTLIDNITQKILVGPVFVTAMAEYDYVNSDNVYDLSFITPNGKRETVLNFSLGQLDSIEGAEDNALDPLYRSMALKIADGLIQ